MEIRFIQGGRQIQMKLLTTQGAMDIQRFFCSVRMAELRTHWIPRNSTPKCPVFRPMVNGFTSPVSERKAGKFGKCRGAEARRDRSPRTAVMHPSCPPTLDGCITQRDPVLPEFGKCLLKVELS